MNAWKWSHTRHNDYMTEERREERGEGRGRHEWLPLMNESDKTIAGYAGCGSHEIEMTPEHAAILEAAGVMYDFICSFAAYNLKARQILASIDARCKEFNA